MERKKSEGFASDIKADPDSTEIISMSYSTELAAQVLANQILNAHPNEIAGGSSNTGGISSNTEVSHHSSMTSAPMCILGGRSSEISSNTTSRPVSQNALKALQCGSQKQKLDSSITKSEGGKQRYLVTPNGVHSAVWNHFGFWGDGHGNIINRKKVMCIECKVELNFCGNTTNMAHHLKRYHPDSTFSLTAGSNFASVNPIPHKEHGFQRSQSAPTQGSKKSPSFSVIKVPTSFANPSSNNSSGSSTQSSSNDSQVPESDSVQSHFDNLVAEFIIRDLVPLNIIEGEGFKNLMSELSSNTNLSSAELFTEKILPDFRTSIENSITSDLALEKDYMHSPAVGIVSLDFTSVNKSNLVTIFLHYINEDMTKVTHCLEVIEINGHKDIKHEIENGLSKYNIKCENILAVVTSDPYMKTIYENSDVRQIPCFGKCISLAVRKILDKKEISDAIKRVRTTLTYLRKPGLKELFQEKRKELYGVAEPVYLDSVFHWVSTYKMLRQYYSFADAIFSLSNDTESLPKNMHKSSDFRMIGELIQFLQQILDTTLALCTSRFGYASLVSVFLHKIQTSILSTKPNDSELTSSVKVLMAKELESLYSSRSVMDFLRLATFLDPRFKSLSFMTEKQRESVKESAKSVILSFNPTLIFEPNVELHEELDLEVKPDLSQFVPPSKRFRREEAKEALQSVLGDMFPSSDGEKRSAPAEAIYAEIRRYQNEVVHTNLDTDPLDWWRLNRDNYTFLPRLVRRILATPSTSAPSDKLFSNISQSRRNLEQGLSFEEANNLLFLNYNMFLN